MEEGTLALFIPIVALTMVGLVLVSFFYFRYKIRARLQETVQSALEKGSELTPELLDRLAGPKANAARDLRLALVWMAVGLAFVLFGAIIDEPDAFRALAAVGTFPILIGIAYLIMWKAGVHGD